MPLGLDLNKHRDRDTTHATKAAKQGFGSVPQSSDVVRRIRSVEWMERVRQAFGSNDQQHEKELYCDLPTWHFVIIISLRFRMSSRGTTRVYSAVSHPVTPVEHKTFGTG